MAVALKARTNSGVVKESALHTKEDRHTKQPFSVSNDRAWAGRVREVLTSVCNTCLLNICYEQDARGTRGGKWLEATKAGQGD